MKVGDIVQHAFSERIGMIIRKSFPWIGSATQKEFDILWRDGTMGKNIIHFDLEVFSGND